MLLRFFPWLRTVFLSGFAVVTVAAQEFYRVDFESARHVIGAPPATVGSDAPTALTGGPSPVVVFAGGSKKLRFEATGLPNFTYRTAEFRLGQRRQFYRIEFDLSIVAIPEWNGGNPSFRLLIDTPVVQNLEFVRMGNTVSAILYGGFPHTQFFLANLPSQTSLRVVIGVNLLQRTWTISMNGQQLAQQPFYSESGDIENLRFSTANVGTGPTIFDLDNIVVTGVTAPVLTAGPQPSTQTVFAGEAATFALQAAPQGTPPFLYQWRRNGTNIVGATNATFALAQATLADAASYSVVVSNEAGSATSSTAVLQVRARPPTLSAAAQPLAQTVMLGDSVTFALREPPGGTSPFTYSWRRNSVALPVATSASLTLSNVTFEQAGSYTVLVTNDAGSVESSPAVLTVRPRPPVIPAVAQPLPASTLVGGAVVVGLQGAVQGTPPFTYQWKRDGTPIAGATDATLVIPSALLATAGNYSIAVTNPSGTSESTAVPLRVLERTRAINLSVRAVSGSGENALIVGFVLAAPAPRSLLVRAAGPALAQFGATQLLADPRLVVLTGGGVEMARNEDWNDTGSSVTSAVFTSVGAFPFPAGSRDAAVMPALPAGNYTAQIIGSTSQEGLAIAEVYDLSAADGGLSRLVNVSARGNVDAQGRDLIIGLVVKGPERQRFVFRAIGPALTRFGVANAADDPRISLRRADGTVVMANDNWGGAAEMSEAFLRVGAFPLDPASRDAALTVELEAGNYTVVIDAVAGSRAGVVLAEAYEAP